MSNVLVTVVGPDQRRDLSVPADAPIAEFLPALLDLVGPPRTGGQVADPSRWSLGILGRDPFPPGDLLQEHDVADGTILHLCDLRPAPPPAAATPPGPVLPARTQSLLESTRALLPAQMTRRERIRMAVRAFLSPAASPPGAPALADPAPPTLFGAQVEGIPPGAGAAGLGPFNGEGPPGVAAPAPVAQHAQTAGTVPSAVPTPTPSGLTLATKSSASDRARRTWQSTDYPEQLNQRIVTPRLRRCATIAVISPKGGVGKTTVSALIGTLLALIRRDRIVAIDANPDFGSLGRLLTPRHELFVDDLLKSMDAPDMTVTWLDSHLGRAAHGLMVLPAPTDPARMERLDEDAYSRVIRRLKEYVGIVVLDCGTGLQEPASRAALATADQLVLVTDAEPATASLVAEAARLLEHTGKPLVLVVNKLPAKGNRLDLERLGMFMPQARGLCIIPSNPTAAAQLAGGGFNWRDAPEAWQLAGRELVSVLLADWDRLGLTL